MEPGSSSSLDSSHGLQIRILVCCYGLISQKASYNRLVTKLWVAYKWLINLITPLSTYKTPLGLIKLLDFDIGLAISRWVGQFHVGLALSRWVGTFPVGGTCEHNAGLCKQQQQPEHIIAESFNSLQFHKRWVEKMQMVMRYIARHHWRSKIHLAWHWSLFGECGAACNRLAWNYKREIRGGTHSKPGSDLGTIDAKKQFKRLYVFTVRMKCVYRTYKVRIPYLHF